MNNIYPAGQNYPVDLIIGVHGTPTGNFKQDAVVTTLDLEFKLVRTSDKVVLGDFLMEGFTLDLMF
jgi:hypothetical protein